MIPHCRKTKKEAIIGKIWKEPDFSRTMVHFLKKACEAGCIGADGRYDTGLGEMSARWSGYFISQSFLCDQNRMRNSLQASRNFCAGNIKRTMCSLQWLRLRN